MRPTAEAISAMLRTRIYRINCEDDLQVCIAQVLSLGGIAFEREKAIASGRIDFYVPATRLGIEVKISGSWSTVAHQLHRYASSGEVAALLLVTTRQAHLAIGKDLYGVPVSIARVRTAL